MANYALNPLPLFYLDSYLTKVAKLDRSRPVLGDLHQIFSTASAVQSMGGNGLIVSFGEVMPMRLGRLQRQSRPFWASAAPEVSTSELAGWCWARQTLMEKRARPGVG
jgi:hypothetical protein